MSCLLAVILAAGGCGMVRDHTEKLGDLDYTVLSPDEFPPQLTSTIEEKKAGAFRITYTDEGYLYICVGYGEQETGGYSITVKELYETANGIYIDTTLMGPKEGEQISEAVSYPYIVIKLADLGKSVIFN
ncbi:MAG: protease complex subunit PrcB family protein [bacterium]|nr:protease complex subunit PrcB family protein [Clostridium sp.]MCM1539482.1 protease complex subunit PrcB family protein [bacterium]